MKMLNLLTTGGYNVFLLEISLPVFEQMFHWGKEWKNNAAPHVPHFTKVQFNQYTTFFSSEDLD